MHVWEAPFTGSPVTTFVAHLDDIGSVIWLTSGPLPLLLTGNHKNQELKVWRLGKEQDPQILQVGPTNIGMLVVQERDGPP